MSECVWVVTHGVDYEGSRVEGVARDSAAALRLANVVMDRRCKIHEGLHWKDNHGDGIRMWKADDEYVIAKKWEVQQ